MNWPFILVYSYMSWKLPRNTSITTTPSMQKTKKVARSFSFNSRQWLQLRQKIGRLTEVLIKVVYMEWASINCGRKQASIFNWNYLWQHCSVVEVFKSFSLAATNVYFTLKFPDDFESKFTFHSVEDFPPPDEFKPFQKTYPSKIPRGKCINMKRSDHYQEV